MKKFLKYVFLFVMVTISVLTISAADYLGDNDMWFTLIIGIFAPMALIWWGDKKWGYDDILGDLEKLEDE